jgi:hypothetical protein
MSGGSAVDPDFARLAPHGDQRAARRIVKIIPGRDRRSAATTGDVAGPVEIRAQVASAACST